MYIQALPFRNECGKSNAGKVFSHTWQSSRSKYHCRALGCLSGLRRSRRIDDLLPLKPPMHCSSIFVQSEFKTKNSMSHKSIFMWSTSGLRWNFCTFLLLNPLVSSQPLEGVVRNYFVFFRLEVVQHISTGRPEVRIIESSTIISYYLPHVLLARPHDRLIDVDHGDELGLLLEQWQVVQKTSLHKKSKLP